MFEELESLQASDIDCNLQFQLAYQLRQSYNLPVPNIQLVVSNEEDFTAIEELSLDGDMDEASEENYEPEYLLEPEQEVIATNLLPEPQFKVEESQNDSQIEISDEDQIIDDFLSFEHTEYEFQDEQDVAVMHDELKTNAEDTSESDDMSKHFV